MNIHLPGDFQTNFLMLLRWSHFLGGITWIGLLYFFNLVNVPFMKELDPATKGKVMPGLMLRALWWFRWASVLTVLAGFAYWQTIVATDAHNGGGSVGGATGSFFLIWTVAWALIYACQIPGKGVLDKGPVLAVIYVVIVLAAAWLFLQLNDRGWQSNRLLAIGIGGGIGWMTMLNVWGVIWRIQKTPYPVDGGQCREWRSHARQGEGDGAAGLSDVADELLAFVPDAVLDGRRRPLPHVWQVNRRTFLLALPYLARPFGGLGPPRRDGKCVSMRSCVGASRCVSCCC